MLGGVLHVPSNEFGLIIHSTADGTQPAAGMGAAVTPGNNAYGAYVSLIRGASLTDDCYELEICINNVGISATARDCVVSLALDPTGGTSFTVSLADLVAGPAVPHTALGGGTWYRFPIFIKAGTSIGVAGAVNSATLTAFNVFCRAKCRPSRPDAIKVGTYIDQFGVTLAASAGTGITEGTVSDGTFVQLGAALTRPCWYWEFGYGNNNTNVAQGAIYVDIAIGASTSVNKVAIANAFVLKNGTEQFTKNPSGAYARGAAGDLVFGRAQASAANTGSSIAAYGVGG